MAKLTVRIFIIWLCLAAMAMQAHAQSKRSMPTLDLPEYVISGVEKATHIGGEKLSFRTDDPETFIPELELRIRPQIPTGQIIVQPEPPSNIAGVLFDYHNYTLSAGSFQSLNSAYNTAIRLGEISLTADGWHHQAPRNTKAGLKFDQGVRSSLIVRSDDKGVFNFTGKYGSRSFEHANAADHNVRLREFSLTATGNSVRSRLGDLSFSAEINRWHLVEYTDSAILSHDLRLAISRRMKLGRMSLKLWQFGEPFRKFDDDFNFSNAAISYTWQQSRDWKVSAMSTLVKTSSVTSDAIVDEMGRYNLGIITGDNIREYTNVRIGVATEKMLSDKDLAYFQFNPIERPISARTMYNKYPMIPNFIGGIVESGSRTVGGYRREINQQMRITTEVFYQTSIDHPVPVRFTQYNWFLETGRLTAMGVKIDASAKLYSSFNLNLFGALQDARITKAGIDIAATEEAELSAGLNYEYWKGRWTATGDLIWYDKKPINLRGSETIPAHTEFNARATFRLKPDIFLSLMTDNLFNQRYYSVPGYDANPLTVMIGVSHVSAK